MKPIIIIFGSTDPDNNIILRSHYTEAILLAGGVPLVVPMKQTKEALQRIVEIGDGFLFSGGADNDPESYGEKKLNSSVEIQPVRDELEQAAFDIIYPTGKPILGICRGVQALNVFCGGTLYQDLPAQYTSTVYHRQTQDSNDPTHRVDIKKDSALYGILGADSIMTNSHHHQAVKDLGRGLRVAALCEDGVIEAVEAPDHPFFIGVQWHPEYGYDKFPSANIFSAFVNACIK